MKKLPRVFLILFFMAGCFFAASQQLELERFVIPDSLEHLSFEKLKEKYNTALYHSYKERLYALCMFKKAKNLNDSIALIKSYNAMFFTEKDIRKKELILDSIANKTGNWKLTDAYVYSSRAELLEDKGDFQGALDNLEIALTHAQLNDDIDEQWIVKNQISALKSNWGDYQGALNLDKEMLRYYQSKPNYRQEWRSEYLISLYNIAIGYTDIHALDSALIVAEIGYKESLELKDTLNAKTFTFTAGVARYYKGNYQAAIDSINKAFGAIKKVDPTNFVFTYLYKGLSYYKLEKYPEAIRNLEITDSIYLSTQYEFPELKDLYQTFIHYYKKTGNTQKQLEYINKLLKADSILIQNYRYVGNNMSKKIDTPLYLAEKNKLLATANQKKKTWIIVALVLGVLLVAGSIFFVIYHKKQRLYKQRFTALLAQQDNKPKHPKTETPALASDLPEALVKDLLLKLEAFEIEKGYLKQHLSLNKLAAKLNTNTAYLSKVINGYKQKSFSNYIHELRIDYAIVALKAQARYRRYNISGLAQEMGYSSAQTFTKAFYTKTGLYPSWFIKELEKTRAS